MPLPLLAIGGAMLIGGILGGGGAYIAQENDKKRIKKAYRELEEQNARLEQKIREAERIQQEAEREIVRERIRMLQFMLRYYQERTKNILENPNLSPTRFARLAATAEQLVIVSNRLDSKGLPLIQDQKFLQIITKAMEAKKNKNPPTKLELAELDAYLEQQTPGVLIRTMKGMFAQRFQRNQISLQDRQNERRDLLLKQAQIEKMIEWNENPQDNQRKLRIVNERLTILPQELKQIEQELSELRISLVVMTTLNDPNRIETFEDRQVQEILQRKLEGRPLTDSEFEYLKLYQVANFSEAQKNLEQEQIYLVAK